MKALLLFLLTASHAFAGLDRLNIQNLNMDYNKPYGKGDVEKITIGFSTKTETQGPYPVELKRTEKNLEVVSPFIDITWNEPWAFLHDMDRLFIKEANVSFGKKDHSATIKNVILTLQEQGAFALNDVSVKCNGKSIEMRVENRLLDDCREKLEATVETLNVPVDFFMAQIVDQYPQEPMKIDERPADSLKLLADKGDFSLVVYTRVIFYAGLRAWGNVSYENNHTTIVIKIHQVKFGYIPITSIVMRELKKRITSPDVTITGNEIRINVHI